MRSIHFEPKDGSTLNLTKLQASKNLNISGYESNHQPKTNNYVTGEVPHEALSQTDDHWNEEWHLGASTIAGVDSASPWTQAQTLTHLKQILKTLPQEKYSLTSVPGLDGNNPGGRTKASLSLVEENYNGFNKDYDSVIKVDTIKDKGTDTEKLDILVEFYS